MSSPSFLESTQFEDIARDNCETGMRMPDRSREAPNIDYRRAHIVARVLSSPRLQERAKWCNLAKELIKDPGVEDRLIGQAMRVLELEKKHRRSRLAQ